MKAKAKPKSPTVAANDPADRKGRLKPIGGSMSDAWNNVLANSALQTMWLKDASDEVIHQRRVALVAGL